ncbi:hypothetical protein B0H34DRAFT_726777 [Crassisporium funariophilum]|nr:hypothetical protein B0H34DRAFT_726777 [Crassisporium funariophilum]
MSVEQENPPADVNQPSKIETTTTQPSDASGLATDISTVISSAVVKDTSTIAEESSKEQNDEAAKTSVESVAISKTKSRADAIAARAKKRAERKTLRRAQAEGFKHAGDVLFEAKKYKAAYPHYLEAAHLWDSNSSYHLSLAVVYRKLEWYEEAAHSATKALTTDPKNLEARYVRGVARMEQRMLKPAKLDFETVLQHDPTHFRARAALTEVTHFIENSTHLGSHHLADSPLDEIVKDLNFGYPDYDYHPLEVGEMSDSSDCEHAGNGVPCRFYNHGGCSRGTSCMFSHAPDVKSVRDDLGKNVCIYFLFGTCKFGADKCIYSHLRDALPERGWWATPENTAQVKAVFDTTEKHAREARQKEFEQMKAYLKELRSSKPPKTAGVGKEKKKKGENVTEGEKDVAGLSSKDKDKEGSTETDNDEAGKETGTHKKEGEDPSDTKQSDPATDKDAQTKAAEPGTMRIDAAPTIAQSIAGFTDYQLNVAPANDVPGPIQESLDIAGAAPTVLPY